MRKWEMWGIAAKSGEVNPTTLAFSREMAEECWSIAEMECDMDGCEIVRVTVTVECIQ